MPKPKRNSRRQRSEQKSQKSPTKNMKNSAPTSVAKPRSKLERICRKVSKSYNHQSTPTFEEVWQKMLDSGATADEILSEPRAQRLCARLDARQPPGIKKYFTHFLGHVILHKFPGQLRRVHHCVTITFEGEHRVECQFPSLAHWCMFAYNQTWRDHWENLTGAPIIPLPAKYELGIGTYIGSWADAADEMSDE